MLKIGNAQGFWGDNVDAPAQLIQQQPDLDYLTLDYLSEVSMSILAIQREKDPTSGYAHDFIDVIRSLIPFWKQGLRFKLVTNAGGLNPEACALACCRELQKEGCFALKIGVISGDDVLAQVKEKEHSCFKHLETEEFLSTKDVKNRLVTANAYLGAQPIVEALHLGADIVITGRVADPSLTVGTAVAHYGWTFDEYDKIAGATIAGHLIECGTQVTGGIYTDWLSVENPADMGFPYVEMASDGSFVITKPKETGGLVTQMTVKEQLLYEIGDPQRYLSPDATVSFLSLQLADDGRNRVKVTGNKGSAPPNTYKVSATYRDGFRAEGTLAIFGREAEQKAARAGAIIFERLRRAGYTFEKQIIECIGSSAIVPGLNQGASKNLECLLRIAASDPRKEAVERFTKEIAPLVTSGPQGTTGYISGRPKVRPVFGYWPCLIPVEDVKIKINIIPVENASSNTL